MKIITRKNAIAKGFPRYFTGKPCKRGHISERQTKNATCLACQCMATTKYLAANPDVAKRNERNRYARNPNRAFEHVKKFYKQNPEKKNAYTAKRHAAKLKATPAWADLGDIFSFYEEAARLTAATGIAHHVDHIVPLQGESVCGLHVPCNLRVITAKENQSKSNSYWPNMWRA